MKVQDLIKMAIDNDLCNIDDMGDGEIMYIFNDAVLFMNGYQVFSLNVCEDVTVVYNSDLGIEDETTGLDTEESFEIFTRYKKSNKDLDIVLEYIKANEFSSYQDYLLENGYEFDGVLDTNSLIFARALNDDNIVHVYKSALLAR